MINYKLSWDNTGERLFETGTKKGVLYLLDENNAYSNGVAWNGLTGVTESPSGAEATALWADDIKYLNLYSAEEFGATVEAYTCPDEFQDLDGTAEIAPGVRIGQQNRKAFGLSYVTTIGNDVKGNDFGYKIHLIYGAQASPSEKGYKTINDSPEAITMSWSLKTTPVNVQGFKPTANIVIDSTEFTSTEQKAKLEAFEQILYGAVAYDSYAETSETTGNPQELGLYEKNASNQYVLTADTTFQVGKTYYEKTHHDAVDPRLPLPDEVASLLGEAAEG